VQKKFEYKVLAVGYNGFTGKPKIDIQATLNEMGLEGWELVSAPHSHGSVASFIFKREIG
jgi:hypothetical protein